MTVAAGSMSALAQSHGNGCHSGPRGAFGLTACERAKLAKLSYAALPNPAPVGFHVVANKFHADARGYRVIYRRADNAEIIYAGSAVTAAAPSVPSNNPPVVAANSAPAQRPRGFFQRLFGEKGAPDVNAAHAGFGSGEQERAPKSGLTANSPAVGMVHFDVDGTGCLAGRSDPSQPQSPIRNGRLTVRGCGMDSPDTVLHVVETTVRVTRY